MHIKPENNTLQTINNKQYNTTTIQQYKQYSKTIDNTKNIPLIDSLPKKDIHNPGNH